MQITFKIQEKITGLEARQLYGQIWEDTKTFHNPIAWRDEQQNVYIFKPEVDRLLSDNRYDYTICLDSDFSYFGRVPNNGRYICLVGHLAQDFVERYPKTKKKSKLKRIWEILRNI